jgi:predicted transcriptional regulator of viral defense system
MPPNTPSPASRLTAQDLTGGGSPCRGDRPYDRIAAIAARHHGLVRTDLASTVGVSASVLVRRAEAGALERLDHSVYRVAGAPDTLSQRLLLACWRTGDTALVSHRTAAMVWGLDGFDRAPLEVLIDRRAPHRRARRGLIVHRMDGIEERDRTVRATSIPVTSVARTLLDLAAVVPPRRLEQALEDAQRRSLCSFEQVASRFVRWARRGRRGVAVMRPLLAERVGEQVPTASELERQMLLLCRAASIEDPVGQHPVDLGDTTVYLDLAWPDRLLAVECDGMFTHGTNLQLPWDAERQNQLQLRGWLVLRYTHRQIRTDPDQCRDEVRRAYLGRAAPLPQRRCP